MSSVSSDVTVPAATIYDPLGASGFNMQPVGSVYRAAPAAAADGESQVFRILPTGELIVSTLVGSPMHVQGAADDNTPPSGFPVYMAGRYQLALPTYDDGDIAAIHMDVNGRLLTALPPGAATETTLAALNTKVNQDYGLSSGAIRTAAQLGNATGAADFGSGNISAQTIRVVIAADQVLNVAQSGAWTVAATQSGAWSVSVSSSALPTGAATEATLSSINTKINQDYGVATAAIRTAAQLGNATGAASFGSGAVDAQTLRVVLPTDQTAIPVTQSGAWSVSVSSSALPTGAATEATLTTLNTKFNQDFGLSSGAIRVAAQLGNASGSIDFNTGNSSAQTPRVVLATDQPAVATKPSTPSALTIKQAAISVGTSAVRLTHDAAAPGADRRRLRFMPDQASTGRFFYGSSTVTSSGATRGVEIFPGQTVEFIDDAGDYYIISDTAAQTVYIVEQET